MALKYIFLPLLLIVLAAFGIDDYLAERRCTEIAEEKGFANVEYRRGRAAYSRYCYCSGRIRSDGTINEDVSVKFDLDGRIHR